MKLNDMTTRDWQSSGSSVMTRVRLRLPGHENGKDELKFEIRTSVW